MKLHAPAHSPVRRIDESGTRATPHAAAVTARNPAGPLDASPRMVAQAQQIQRLFGPSRAGARPVQRVCYSIADGDHTTGSEVPGSAFNADITDAYYQAQAEGEVTFNEADHDEETDDLVVRTRQLQGVLGNVDHIVPRALGGGGLESNSRVLNAASNNARSNNFNLHNNNHPLAQVRVIHGGNEYTHALAARQAGATDGQIDALQGLWGAPWNGGPLHDDRPPVGPVAMDDGGD